MFWRRSCLAFCVSGLVYPWARVGTLVVFLYCESNPALSRAKVASPLRRDNQLSSQRAASCSSSLAPVPPIPRATPPARQVNVRNNPHQTSWRQTIMLERRALLRARAKQKRMGTMVPPCGEPRVGNHNTSFLSASKTISEK